MRSQVFRLVLAGVLPLGVGVLAADGTGPAMIPVPSGQPLSLIEVLSEQDGAMLRFRFLTPQIGAVYDYMAVYPDFQALCDEQVAPALAMNEIAPDRLVLSMSAEPVPFGSDVPDVLQFFELFTVNDGVCISVE